MAARPERVSSARSWCGKIGYKTKAQAKHALKNVRNRIKVQHFYRCPLCNLWHLTSK